jgi:hypothetical protein
MYVKLKKKVKSGQASIKLTYRQDWLLKNFSFLDAHLVVRTATKTLGSIPSSPQSLQPLLPDPLESEEETAARTPGSL